MAHSIGAWLAAWASGLLISVAPDGALVDFGLVGWIAVGVTGCALFTLWMFTRRAVALTPAPA